MFNRFPSDEPDTECLLLISHEKDAFSSGYAHLRATVVRRAKKQIAEPKSGSDWGDGKDAIGYRNAEWSSSKKTALYLAGFAVRCQMDTKRQPYPLCNGEPYATKLVFRGVHHLEACEAQHIATTFKKVDKLWQRYDKVDGRLDDGEFARHCLRLAHILGIKTFVSRKKSAQDTSRLDASLAYTEYPATDVIFMVSTLVDRVHGRN